MGLSSTTINYTAGDKTDNQWLNGVAISFVNLTLLIILSVSVGCVRARYLNIRALSFLI